MLVDPDERAVDEDVFEIRIVAEGLENALPDTLLRPAPEARIDGEPLCRTLPEDLATASPRNPKNGFDKEPRPLLPGSPALPDSSGAIRSHWVSLNINRIKADLHFQP
jgi:hypothetical protein